MQRSLVILFLFLCWFLQSHPSFTADYIDLFSKKFKWQFRWNEKVKNAGEWQNFSVPGTPPGEKKASIIWFRTKLPEISRERNFFLLDLPPFLLKVFIAEKEIQSSGSVIKKGTWENYRALPTSWPIFALKQEDSGKYLILKYFVARPVPPVLRGHAYSGRLKPLIRKFFIKEGDQIFIGLYFLFFGTLVFFVQIFARPDFLLWNYIFLSLASGLHFMGTSALVQVFFPFLGTSMFMNHFPLLLIPIGMGRFFNQILGPGFWGLFRKVWQFQSCMIIFLCFLNFICGVPFYLLMGLQGPALLLEFLLLFLCSLYELKHGKKEALIISKGLAISGIFGIHDSLYGMGFFIHSRFLAHWGAFLFSLCLLFILIARFFKAQTELKIKNESFSRFVPTEFLKYLEKETIEEVELGDQVQKEMTILFSDIRSFTTITEKMTAKESFDFINSFLRQMGPVIRKNNGFIDKYIGDAIMAIFPYNVEDALDAAIEMREELARYNTLRVEQGREDVDIGIGIHKGILMLGIVGENVRLEGTVISDAVNLTSRIESLTKNYKCPIIVSGKVSEEIGENEKFIFRFLDEVKVKGKSKAVPLFEARKK
ncbi:adenylate/guanylate cyclase domain-containing protein [Candidatus Riflebacteria bacterium]